jgi:hypothetical protein
MGINSVPTSLTGLSAKVQKIPQEMRQRAQRAAHEQVCQRVLAGEQLSFAQRETAEREAYQSLVMAMLEGKARANGPSQRLRPLAPQEPPATAR